MANIFWSVVVFLFGISIGSFLNVCIYRLGKEESIVRPSSHCPKCQKPIRWKDNIPLLSFVLLRGQCRDCKAKISWRYPLVEFLTGIILLAVYFNFGFTVYGFSYALMICGLIVATFIDFDFRIIPDEISLGGLGVALLLSFMFPILQNAPGHWMGLLQALLGALVGGGVLWILGVVGDFIFKKESMGGGDIKLLAMLGAFMGWPRALLILPVASLIGAVIGIIIKLRTKDSTIAFGPYLSLGAIVVLFWGAEIISLIFCY